MGRKTAAIFASCQRTSKDPVSLKIVQILASPFLLRECNIPHGNEQTQGQGPHFYSTECKLKRKGINKREIFVFTHLASELASAIKPVQFDSADLPGICSLFILFMARFFFTKHCALMSKLNLKAQNFKRHSTNKQAAEPSTGSKKF